MRLKRRFETTPEAPDYSDTVPQVYRYEFPPQPMAVKLWIVLSLAAPIGLAPVMVGVMAIATRPAKVERPVMTISEPAPIVRKRERWEPPTYLMPKQDMPK